MALLIFPGARVLLTGVELSQDAQFFLGGSLRIADMLRNDHIAAIMVWTVIRSFKISRRIMRKSFSVRLLLWT